jgi:hypothetical protein
MSAQIEREPALSPFLERPGEIPAADKEKNDLTCRAIVKLAKDEYRSGKMPLNRLAHTIRRMMPGSAELLSILPDLKAMLLAEGMSLADYLELVRTLNLSIESESLTDTLKDAADSAGASVNDLVAAIRSKPEEAARLVLLAAEVRSCTGEEDASRLPDMLTEYIEEVSAKMAVDSCSASDAADSGSLRKVLAVLEMQMFNQLEKQHVPARVMQNVKTRLTGGFEEAAAAANNQMLAAAKNSAAPAPEGGKMKLPPEALNAGNLLFLMNKEIRRNLRYKTPFSTVMISIESVAADGRAHAPKPADAVELLPQLLSHIMTILRDVDMMGTLDNSPIPVLFAMLPMTGEEGAAIVRDKIVKKAAASEFTLRGKKAGLSVKVSVTLPGAETKSLKTYMMLARQNHKRQ